MAGTFADNKDRQIIPRWRDFRTTLRIGELRPTRARAPAGPLDPAAFEWRRQEFELHRTPSFAADFLSAAVASGREADAIHAAEAVASWGGAGFRGLSELARRVLAAGRPAEGVPTLVQPEHLTDGDLHARIRRLKARLASSPRNPFTWTDSALFYECMGQPRRALAAIDVALALAPTNRFVLRSAARLFLREADAERAHAVLLRGVPTSEDPWILAAEIAVASVAGKTSRFVAKARRQIQSGRFAPFQLAELASAVGTLELESGGQKRGRRLIRQSLEDPTENAIAQASWAGRRFGGIELSAFELGYQPFSFEAEALTALFARDWGAAAAAAQSWLDDQPFSSRPAVLASYVHGLAFEDYQKSRDFASLGVRANPQDPVLWNNLAFALIQLEQFDKARTALHAARQYSVSEVPRAVVLATEGLLAFREGAVAKGRTGYTRAIELLRTCKRSEEAARAELHWAMEELRIRTQDSNSMARTVLDAVRLVHDPGVEILRDRVAERMRMMEGSTQDAEPRLFDRPVA